MTEIIHIVGISQSLFLAIYFFKNKKIKGYFSFGLLLFCISCTILAGYIYETKSVLSYPNLARIGFALSALIGPLFYITIKLLIKTKNGLNLKDSVFFLVPLGEFIYLLPFYFLSNAEKLKYLQEDLIHIHPDCLFMLYFALLNNLISVFYSLILFRKTLQDDNLKEENSSIKKSKYLKKVSSYHFSSIFLLSIFFIISLINPDLLNKGIFSGILSFLIIIFAYLLIYCSKAESTGFILGPPRDKYQNIPMSKKKIEKFGKKIDIFIKEEMPYLDPDFKLNDIADKLNINNVKASQVINRYYNKSFNKIVSEYRIERAMKKLSDRNIKQTTILEIAFECGFNTKSSFNDSFKKYTGKTPTEWRKHEH